MRISAFEDDAGFAAYNTNSDAGYVHHIYVNGVKAEYAVTADDVLNYVIALIEIDEITGEHFYGVYYGDVKIERVKRTTND